MEHYGRHIKRKFIVRITENLVGAEFEVLEEVEQL